MACAWSLSRFPERFEVEVWEALQETGGVASTCAIDGGECNNYLGTPPRGMLMHVTCYTDSTGPSGTVHANAYWLPSKQAWTPSSQTLAASLPPAGEEINDQVQGGAPSYRNNLLFFKVWRAKAALLPAC